MSYRSRLSKIQEKRNLRQAIVMFGIGLLVIVFLIMYGVKAMAFLAISIDKIKYGNSSVDVSDNIPPAPPSLWADFQATNSATVKIWGVSEPKSKVVLYRGTEQIKEEKTSEDGKVDFGEVELQAGGNIFTGVAVDEATNKSHVSEELHVTYGDKNPDVSLEKPNDGQNFLGNDNPIEVKGKTVAKAKVWVNSRLTISDNNGNFVLKYSLQNGDNELNIRVIDETGNETTKLIKVKYQP